MIKNQQIKPSDRLQQAIDTVQAGGMVVMLDDEDRENEGDIVFSADFVTAEKINFLAKEARGLVCLTLSSKIINKLKLPMMVDDNRNNCKDKPAFTVSIEAADGVTTGISAADRAQTIRVAVNPDSTSTDITVPGHIFPLKANDRGVLERQGHTEGSVDLMKLSGLSPAAVICEVMNDDGTMAKRAQIEAFSEKHNIPVVTIADIITFRKEKSASTNKESTIDKSSINENLFNNTDSLSSL